MFPRRARPVRAELQKRQEQRTQRRQRQCRLAWSTRRCVDRGATAGGIGLAEVIEAARARLAERAAMLPSRFFSDLTQPENRRAVQEESARHPAGGQRRAARPHLPTGTDTLAANVMPAAVRRADGRPWCCRQRRSASRRCTCVRRHDHAHPDTYMRVVIETCVSTAKHGAKYLMLMTGTRAIFPRSPSPPRRCTASTAMTVLTVQACTWRKSCTGGAATPSPTAARSRRWPCSRAGPTSCISTHRLFLRSHHGHKMDKLRRTRSYQPVLTDIRSIAPTAVRQPAACAADKGRKMLNRPSPRRSHRGVGIFRQFDAVQGGTAEMKQVAAAG